MGECYVLAFDQRIRWFKLGAGAWEMRCVVVRVNGTVVEGKGGSG